MTTSSNNPLGYRGHRKCGFFYGYSEYILTNGGTPDYKRYFV